MPDRTSVILVNEQGQSLGVADKHQAHQEGLLHRAFSVMLWRQQGHTWQVLLQQRQHGKYHSGGLWANSCCSHPTPEQPDAHLAAQTRLQHELGISGITLIPQGHLCYRAQCGDMIEHEWDERFSGYYPLDSCPFNLEEVRGIAWVPWEDLQQDLKRHPERYAPWVSHLIEGWLPPPLP